MRKAYESDITRSQYEMISEKLEKAKKTTRPRKVDLYEVICAIFYLIKNGCTWRDLPHDFPNWKLVYYYYGVWTKKDKNGMSLLDYIQGKLAETERIRRGRAPEPSMLIADSKSIQNADTAEESGYDGGKKLQA